MSTEEEQQSCVGGYWSSFTSNMASFGKFLYNSEEGTIMGRDGGSWLRISIFYLGYYLFLAGLFAISIHACLSALDPYLPYFQTRLQYPGMTIMPRTDKFDPAALDIRFDDKEKKTYLAYIDGITDVLKPYNASLQEGDEFTDCTTTSLAHQKFDDTVKTAKACKFDVSNFLTECQQPPYGYPLSPCIFVRLNRVINWKPVPFMSLTDELASSEESGAMSLAEHLKMQSITYNKDYSYITCSGKSDADQENLGKAVYGPDGISAKFFPYFGKGRQEQYISPMVSVQFPNIKRNVEIKATCKVYARNMIDLARINVGYVDFKVKIDTTK